MVLGQLPDAATPTTIVGAFIFIGVTMLGLIGWLMRHVFITTIPEMMANDTKRTETLVKAHETAQAGVMAEMANQRAANDKALAAQTQVYREESRAERDLCAGQFAALNSTLVGMAASLDEDRKLTVALVNQHTSDAMGKYRHDLNDMINTAVMGKELAAATARRAADGKSQS